ncbi:creatininase family protein [Ruminococcaceae bacterium OttesenSCG-928-D13]|nr:creatininase family protein [Ruminococcaceae bacterium OttesenSCG-928-D13]
MRLAHLTWPKAEAYFKQSDMVILATGSIETHGRHNPLGLDTLVPDRLLELIEEKSDVLIAPTIPYGATDDLTGHAGTISVGDELMYGFTKRVVMGLYAHGARKFVFVNGHGGNMWALTRICNELSVEGALGAVFNWWKLAPEFNPEWAGGHGGGEETAAVMAVDPRLVDKSAFGDMELVNDLGDDLPTTGFDNVAFKGHGVFMPRMCSRYSKNGWVGPDRPETATEEWGKEMLQTVADYIADFCEAFKKVKL